MAGKPSFEVRLQKVREIANCADSPEGRSVLAKALTDRSSFIVGRAAEIIGESELGGFESQLERCFWRFMQRAVKMDPGCHAKKACATALYRLGIYSEELFIAGVAYEQAEPAFGGAEDTAVAVRNVCALGLVRMNHPQALLYVAQLMADDEPRAREGAAKALGYSGLPEALPLLQYKITVGDKDPTVTGACFAAMLAIDGGVAVDRISPFLASPDIELVEAAALALGGSRIPEALPPLTLACEESVDREQRRVLCLSVALMRRDEAFDCLLAWVEKADRPLAMAAVEALAVYKHDEGLQKKVRQSALLRGEDAVLEAVPAPPN